MRPITALFLVACAGGKGQEVGEVCAQLLGCMYAIDPAEGTLYEGSFGEESACWSDEQKAADCEASCVDTLAAADNGFPLVEACDVGDGFTSAEVFAVAGAYAVTVTAVEGDDPCDDIEGGEGHLDMAPLSGAAFALDGRIAFEGTYSQSFDEVSCELVWEGFACEPFQGVQGENRISGSFTPDLLSTTILLDADASDQDPDTSETVDCTYHVELLGTPG